MKKIQNILPISKVVFFMAMALCVLNVSAQTTNFSHQGQLNNNGNPANGNFDFEFKLFDSLNGGTQVGSALQRASVAVVNGTFTVSLDFGAAALPGANRFLEIAVRSSGGGTLTQLSPRQPITSTPYAIRSLNAATAVDFSGTMAGDVTGTQSNTSIAPGSVTDSKIANAQVVKSINTLKDNVTLAAGSNITITPSGSTLTIASTGGSGGGILNQTTQQSGANFNISGTGTAGVLNAATQFDLGGNRVLSNAGFENLFAGVSAGSSNSTGSANTFFGFQSGAANTTGISNTFFGTDSGSTNTTGIQNSFFGKVSGSANTIGNFNSFFGNAAGVSNTSGGGNSLLGAQAGDANTTGGDNSFFGSVSGATNTTGSNNTLIGRAADVGSGDLTFATAIGANAVVTTSNTVVLGRISDTVLAPGLLQVNTLATAGATTLCRNASNRISSCSSSLRYKENINPFLSGLAFINQLRPISFDWKDGGMQDVGFGAEDIAKIDQRFVVFNEEGEVEGVKYDRLSVAFVNAFKEQQAMIETQQKLIEQQQKQMLALMLFVCKDNQNAQICQEQP